MPSLYATPRLLISGLKSQVVRSVGLVRKHELATAASQTAPLMWRLAHGMFDSDVHMAEKYPGIPEPVSIQAPAPPGLQRTTLPNGVRVVSQDRGGHVAAVALHVDAGSRYESSRDAGVSHLVEHLAFKGSAVRSKFRMVRDIEKSGAMLNSSLSREGVMYFGEAMRGSIGDIVGILAESATMPAAAVKHGEDPAKYDIAMAEINEQKNLIRAELADFKNDISGVVTEAIHMTAFDGNTLGRPMMAEERNLDQLTPHVVADYISRVYTPDRIVLSAANMDHDSLVAIAEKTLGQLAGKSKAVNTAAQYTGGSLKISGSGDGHFAIGFEGVSLSSDDLIPACVLQTLLGGGGSFSSGGPGKGMYTRLYTEVLNCYGWIGSAAAFHHCFTDAGVFGIQASTPDPSQLNNLIEVIGSQIGRLSVAPTKDELERAKAMTKSSLIMNLESRLVVCEDMARQIASGAKYLPPADLVRSIDAVTQDDLLRVSKRAIGTKPTIVMYGDAYDTYSYDAIVSSIGNQAKLAA